MSIESYLNQHFSERQISEWKATSIQEKESLILWVLKNKKIKSQEYSDWAFKQYQLPRLKMIFFEKHKPNQTLLDRYQNIWPDHVFPIKEWKEVLYLACLEPIKTFSLPQEFQWVLAPIEGLLLFKGNTTKSLSDPSDILQMPDEAESSAHSLKADSLDLGHSLSLNSSSAPSDSLNAIDFNQMTVISSEPKSQEKNKTPLKTTEVLKTKKASKNKDLLLSPSVLKKKPSNQSSSHSSAPSPQPLSIPIPNSSHSSQKSSAAVNMSLNKPISLKSPSQPSPLVKKKPSLVTSLHLPAKDISKADEHHLDDQQDQGVFDEILNRLAKIFDQNMILILKNKVLKPWKWDKSWLKQPSTHNIILLNKPSVFRIVYKSNQKYHGYVVPNPTNSDFFQTWNQGVYPEHLTILPLIKDKIIKGMLLSTTSQEKGKNLSLDKLDVLALESSEKLFV